MEKALKMGKASATGSFQLFVGVVLSTVIMAIGTIILTRLLTPSEYGLYTVALIPATMLGLFRDWGINSAITKHVAHFRASGKEEDIHEVVVAGIIFEILTGLCLSLLSVFLSGFIASAIFHSPESANLITLVSLSIFTGALFNAAQSSFVGFERMELNSMTLFSQSVSKSVMSLFLVFLGFGAFGAALGYAFSYLVGGAFGVGVLYFSLLRTLKGKKIRLSQTFGTLKKMLRYGVPLSVSTVLEGARLQFYGFMMAFYVSKALIGNYQVANNFLVLMTFLTIPISTVLFPAFGKLDSHNEPDLLRIVFSSSVKYTAMLLVPAAAAVTVLSQPIVSTLFGQQWAYAPFLLSILVMINLFSGFGNLSLTYFMAGLGETKTLMKLSFLTLSIGIPLAFVLIPALGIVGVALVALLDSIPSIFVGLLWIWKHYQITIHWGISARIFSSSIVAAAVTYFFLMFLNTVDWLRLIVGGAIFLMTYLLVSFTIGAINPDDIGNLRTMVSGLGFISRIADKSLGVVQKIASSISFGKKEPEK